jgi:hypothetical protein
VNDQKHSPDLQKLSIVIAMILLAYATTAFVRLPTRTLDVQLPGFLLVIRVNFSTLVAVVAAILAAAGSDWILADHPEAGSPTRWHHWLVPAFTAVAIGISLGTLPLGPTWWIVFGFGAILMAGILSVEYVSLDPDDARYSFAVLGLDAVSYTLFLIIVLSITGAGYRLYILLAAIVPTVFLLSARSLFLHNGGNWRTGWAAAVTLIVTQLAVALFYLPFRPIQFSLILLGLLYGLNNLANNFDQKLSGRALWLEPLVMTTVFIFAGFILA